MKTPAAPHPVVNDQFIALDAVIIGAGFSGMYQLLSLRDKLGMQVKVLEAGAGVGLSLIHI